MFNPSSLHIVFKSPACLDRNFTVAKISSCKNKPESKGEIEKEIEKHTNQWFPRYWALGNKEQWPLKYGKQSRSALWLLLLNAWRGFVDTAERRGRGVLCGYTHSEEEGSPHRGDWSSWEETSWYAAESWLACGGVETDWGYWKSPLRRSEAEVPSGDTSESESWHGVTYFWKYVECLLCAVHLRKSKIIFV